MSKVPLERVAEVATMLKTIQAQESIKAAKEKAEKTIANLVDIWLRVAPKT